MYLFELNRRLQRLNPRLFLDTAHATSQLGTGAENTVGLYYRRYGREDIPKGASSAEARVFERAGEMEFVCAVPINWVPEKTLVCKKSKRILARGWRDIVNCLVSKRLVSQSRVNAVF